MRSEFSTKLLAMTLTLNDSLNVYGSQVGRFNKTGLHSSIVDTIYGEGIDAGRTGKSTYPTTPNPS